MYTENKIKDLKENIPVKQIGIKLKISIESKSKSTPPRRTIENITYIVSVCFDFIYLHNEILSPQLVHLEIHSFTFPPKEELTF